ncbi:MAG: hypothetical protein HAW67_05535 [Endozoicomonadaceae bacterium]|nr:hypothetical protein [Endozoicomonadaceae bacterium]
MKKITPLDIDDIQLMQDLCNKTSTASSPYLAQEYFVMKDQYETYVNNNGLPWLCPPREIGITLANKLKYHYEKMSPKVELSYIKKIRKELSPRTCPMCGSLGVSTVDHYLPKANYPEWTIFSKNLVPACDCNVQRSTRVCGVSPHERVFHPYYDEALQNRLISCRLTGNLEAPDFSISALMVVGVSNDMTEFHLDEIVRKTNIVNWLKETWEELRLFPSAILVNIDHDEVISKAILIQQITKLLGKYDTQHRTPNNWYSIFMHGVLNDVTVLEWIVNQQNGIIDGTITLT